MLSSSLQSRVVDIMKRDAQKDPATDPNALIARLLVNQVFTLYIYISTTFWWLIDIFLVITWYSTFIICKILGGQKVGETDGDDICLWGHLHWCPWSNQEEVEGTRCDNWGFRVIWCSLLCCKSKWKISWCIDSYICLSYLMFWFLLSAYTHPRAHIFIYKWFLGDDNNGGQKVRGYKLSRYIWDGREIRVLCFNVPWVKSGHMRHESFLF